ncbi:MAG: hypothetical protein IJJ28_03940 [Lentisphaeria bacterium]|nr:hypothetical protein [Lentisphaeria bacterium]
MTEAERRETLERGLRAAEYVFCRPDPGTGRLTAPAGAPELVLGALRTALVPASAAAAGAARLAHYLNALGSSRDAAAELLGDCFAAALRHGVILSAAADPADARREFLLGRMEHLFAALRRLPERLSSAERPELSPGAEELFSALPEGKAAVCAALAAADELSRGRCFLFRSGKIIPVAPESVKPVEKFFGFAGMRAIYRDHFRDFVGGVCNVPLLIHSLPGYGKTSMVLSHALASPEVTVILPEPAALEREWDTLLDKLIRRPDRKFVLFFDDIDPRAVDWYHFRTNVGGAFSPPAHIMVVLSSNYEFPAGILSRGRRMSYPVFDEVRCTEMVEDFLRDFGLKRPPRNLVSLIAADYTEEFGQKKFTELSPRTLMRYLTVYGMNRNKRRTIAEMSLGEVITKPDGELFYEFNIELMRSLYGEEYIQKLLKDKLKNL